MALGTLNCNADDGWKSRYGLQGCDNPIFTRPDHEVPGGRVEGAGINMNDGEAYTNHYIDLSGEWHYAPKLNYAPIEVNTIHRVLGTAHNKEHPEYFDQGTLKFNAKRINGNGALVSYRAGAMGGGDLYQYIATYDAKGNLVDALMMGNEFTIDDLFKVEPHGNYTLDGHWSGIEGKINNEQPSRFTLTLKNRYKVDGKRIEWSMTRTYHVDAKGIIHLDNVTSENAPKFNTTALEMTEMSLTPVAGNFDKLMTTLNRLQPALAKTEQGRRVLNRQAERLFAWNPQAFLMWVWRCPKCNLTRVVCDKVRNDHYVTDVFNQPSVADAIEGITHARARNYWFKTISRAVNED